MLCTVMIPTRGRSQHLENLIQNIFNSVSDTNNIEIVFRCDDDDTETINFLKEKVSDSDKVRMIVGPRGIGYSELHVFYNQICESSDAEWFFLFNDDAILNKTDWDVPLAEIKDVVVLQPMTTNGRGWQEGNIFPIMHRKIYETLGHFSVCNMNDCYVSNVANRVDLEKRIDFIEVVHIRDAWHDQTAQESALFQAKQFQSFSDCMKENLPIDVEKLRNSDLVSQILPDSYILNLDHPGLKPTQP